MRNVTRLAALVLPIIVLGIYTAHLIHHRAHAPTYNVVVEGYDPRDLIYGKYVQLRYVWDDPKTTYPEHLTLIDLPISGRFYTPEHDAVTLQTMLRQDHEFIATVTFMDKDIRIKDVHIDGQGWKEALDAFRQNPDNTNQ